MSISGDLGSRTVCSFQIPSQYPFSESYEIGAAVEVRDNADNLIFGGTIDTDPFVVDDSGAQRVYQIKCVDYSQIADRHLVAYAYVSQDDDTGLFHPINAEASNTFGTISPATNAIDRDTSTEYVLVGGVDGDWFSFDLGEERAITDIYIMVGTLSNETPKAFDVQSSDDNSTWSTIDSFSKSSATWDTWTGYNQITITETNARYFRILVHTYNDNLNRAVVITELYASGPLVLTAGSIIKDVVERFFSYGDASENIDVSNVANGPQIDKAVFNYIQASQVFSELADIAGYVWYIDYDKKLYFYDSSANAAPFSLTETSENWRGMTVSNSREKYRNKQIIRGGNSLTEERVDSIAAIADQTLFEYPFSVGTASAVTVDSVSKTIGVNGYDEGRDFYWSYGSPVLTATTAPGAGAVVALTYQGLFPILISEVLPDEILARRAIEGGTGVYESIIDNNTITAQTTGVQVALAYLRKFGTIPKTIDFTTDEIGLRTGQLLTVNIPTLDLDDDFLIESVRFSDYGGVLNRYKVHAVSGEALGGWLDFFNSLARQTQNINIYDEDQVILLKTSTDTITLSDDATLFSTGKPESRTDLARADFSETDWVHP